MWYSNHYY